METVEATHEKLVRKFSILDQMVDRLREMEINDGLIAAVAVDYDTTYEDYYNVSTNVLARYYGGEDNVEVAHKYKAIIDSYNVTNRIDALVCRVISTVNGAFDEADTSEMTQLTAVTTVRKKRKVKCIAQDNCLAKLAENIEQIQIYGRKLVVENKCECGKEYDVLPESSQKVCSVCGVIKDIQGVVFKNSPSYPSENQRCKHSGYDTSRHYRFWIDRLQAIEKKSFETETLDIIRAAIRKQRYTVSDLTCEKMREILKRAKVPGCDSLNEHVPLLIKTFGGPAPPLLTPQENKLLHTRFSKAMLLYTLVNPAGRNKPYYPYFIAQLVAEMFKGNPEKLRLLNYIHLQSADTIRKNDGYYQSMCAMADPSDGMVFHFVGYRSL